MLSNCDKSCFGNSTINVSGARISLYPMDNDFVNIILSGLNFVNTDKVWKQIDDLSTCFRGKRIHVFDVVKSLFINSYKDNLHLVLEATFSKGCPGDVEADAYIDVDDDKLNEKFTSNKHFLCKSKISFYPLGNLDYMNHIQNVIKLTKDKNVFFKSSHYVTILKGDVQDIFDVLEEIFKYGENKLSHFVLQVTISTNSPTGE